MNRKIIEQKVKQDFIEAKRGEIYRYIIDDVERIIIERALELAGGNKILAAKTLGINRNTIHSKIKKLKIKVNKFKL
ncbi:MAG: helix-turn-helix domain-containing protein [Candidatus Aceula meridiana]|nr:helix-turn-helix domain-containing protein [Candidatus Aceula meridiana]